MKQLTSLGMNNPLWRRVQRHAQMSAIFGAPQPAARSAPTAVSLQFAAPVTPLPADPLLVADSPPPAPPAPRPTPAAATSVMPAVAAPPSQPPPITPSVPPAAGDSDPGWRRLQSIFSLHQQKKQTEESATPPAALPSLPRPPDLAPPPIRPSAAPPAAAPAAPPPSPSEPSSSRQPLPLEAVWPVQKAAGAAAAPAVQRSPEPTTSPRQAPAIPDDEAQKVDSELRRVAPGQATDSPIELLMPSRPRPKRAQAQEKPATPPAPEAAAPHRPPADPEAAVPPLPDVIATDVGPLPADLWETLGETPPRPTDTPPAPGAAVPQPALPPAAPPNSPTFKESAATAPTAVSTQAHDPASPAPPTEPAAPPPTPGHPPAEIVQRAIDAGAEPKPALAGVPLPSPRTPAAAATPLAEPRPATGSQPAPAAATIAAAPIAPAAVGSQSSISVSAPATELPRAHPPRFDPLPAATTAAPPPAPAKETIAPAASQPPVSMKETAAPAAAKRAVTAEATAVQRAVSQAEAAPAPTMVQRQPQMPSMQTAAAALPTFSLPPAAVDAAAVLESEIFEKEEETGAADFDIDELSRRVYQALKRKLAVEWERGHGR